MTRHPLSPTPFVVLRHEEPGGGHHFDWLIAREPAPPSGARVLLAFRCPLPPGGASIIDATRMADHRAHYLTYEGPLSEGRGEVRRVMRGLAQLEEADERTIELGLIPDGAPRVAYRADMLSHPGTWRLTHIGAPAHVPPP